MLIFYTFNQLNQLDTCKQLGKPRYITLGKKKCIHNNMQVRYKSRVYVIQKIIKKIKNLEAAIQPKTLF